MCRSTFSASGVVAGVELLQPLTGHMGIDLGGGEVAVAQQQLHHAQISPMIKQMGRECMAQVMR